MPTSLAAITNALILFSTFTAGALMATTTIQVAPVKHVNPKQPRRQHQRSKRISSRSAAALGVMC
jgi:hypothetical protein